MQNSVENIIGENKSDYLGRGGYIWWVGEVEDKDDPLNLGRVKVRVLGWYTGPKKDYTTALPKKDLPWALVLQPTNQSGADGLGFSAGQLDPGAFVLGFFMDGEEAQLPVVIGVLRTINKSYISETGGIAAQFGEGNSLASDGSTREYSSVNSFIETPGGDQSISGGNTSPSPNPAATGGTNVSKGGTNRPDLPINALQQFPGSNANPKPKPSSCKQPAADGIQGVWKTYEYSICVALEDLASTLSESVPDGKGGFVNILTGSVENVDRIVAKIENLITTILSGFLGTVKQAVMNLIADVIDPIKKTLSTGIPLVATTIIKGIAQVLQTLICGLDSTIFALLNDPIGFVTDFVTGYVNQAFDLASGILTTVSSIKDYIFSKMKEVLVMVKEVLTAMKTVESIVKGIKGVDGVVGSLGKDIFKIDFEKLSVDDIVNFIVNIVSLFATGCNTDPVSPTNDGWVPFIGGTGCNEDTINDLINFEFGSDKQSIFDLLYQNINPLLSTITTFANGAYLLQNSTPGIESTITRYGNGTTHTAATADVNSHKSYLEDEAKRQAGLTPEEKAKSLLDPKNPIVGDYWGYAGTLTQNIPKDYMCKVGGDNFLNVDGDLRLKVTGDFHLEIGGGMFVNVASAPKSKNIKTGKSAGSLKQVKSTISFAGECDIGGSGRVQLTSASTTVAAHRGTDVKIISDTYNINAASINLNATNDLNLSGGSSTLLSTPHLMQNINIPPSPLPKVITGITTTVSGSILTTTIPGLAPGSALPTITTTSCGPMVNSVAAGGIVNNVVAGGIVNNITAGGKTDNILAGAWTATCGAGAITITAKAGTVVILGTVIMLN
jgi:hypothetical protein